MGVLSGQQDLVVAGGVESMSRVPMGSDVEWLDAGNLALRQEGADGAAGHLGRPHRHARGLHARRRRPVRAPRASTRPSAQKEGRFAKSLFTVVDLEGKPVLDKDEHPRAGATIEGLTKLEPRSRPWAAPSSG
jgi:acetyl-CoA C-acetyltransferase